MLFITFFSCLMTAFCGAGYAFWHSAWLYSLAITFGTVLYHFGMRLLVGTAVQAIFHNCMNEKRHWFQPRKWESRFYDIIRVKHWKKYMPTYASSTFALKEHSLKEVVQATCQAEVVHEIIMVLSFVPLLFSVWFDEFLVFLLTSAAAALFDSCFVILQRYNRPRLLRLMHKKG